MTIKINSDWYGNTPKFEFQTPEETVQHMRSNPSFEYIGNSPVRPYGDIDHKVPADWSYTEFVLLDTATYMSLINYRTDIGRKLAVYTSSSYEARKISLRWVVPDVYVDSHKHAQAFAKTIYEQIDFPDGVAPDMSVYKTNQKMRMVGTSKPGETRPLVMLDGKIEDTLITYIPPEAEHIHLDLAPEYTRETNPTIIENETMIQLLDCMSVDAWTDYGTCMRLIFAMCSQGVSSATIHKYAAKAKNYGAAWVDGLIRSYNPERSPTLPYIRRHARLGNPTAYSQIELPYNNTNEGISKLFTLTTNADTVFENGRYMSDIEIQLENGKFTGAYKAMMGLGKSTCMKKLIRKFQDKRILLLSTRVTFSNSIFDELKQLGFVHYMDEKTRLSKTKDAPQVITADKVIMSLHPASMKFINTQSYDIIMLDESETLMAGMSYITNIYNSAPEYVGMYEMFERFMRESEIVLAFDAFLTDRTVNMLKMLRGKTHLTVNTTMPYCKTATIVENPNDFKRLLNRRIRIEKKKVASVWGTNGACKEFHDELGRMGVKSVFYSGDSNKKEKAEHMSDVNKHWAEYQSVGYTSTITVGINYDNKEHEFDQLSLYATSHGILPRDYVQMLHRARSIKDDEVIAYIQKGTFKHNLVLEKYKSYSAEEMWDAELEVSAELLKSLGENLADYKRMPEWLRHVILWNRDEKKISMLNFYDCMVAYLEACGITEKGRVDDSGSKTSHVKKAFVDVDSVRVIEHHEEADYLINHQNMLTEEESYVLKRYMLSQYTNTVDQHIWEIWLKDESVVKNAYLVVSADPSYIVQNQNVKVLECVPKNMGALTAIKSLFLDWHKSWVLPVDQVPAINLSLFNLRKRTDKDTPDQYCRELCRSIQDWCGYAVSVKQKRIRKGQTLTYEYTMVYDYDKSLAKYVTAPYTD
jgi:hypothetical protein